jgi:transcription elongation factor GreA
MEMMTKAERELVQAKLDALIANRVALSNRIAEARAHGDLRENGEYHAAREQQGIEEAEIRRFQDRLANSAIIDASMAKATEGVVFVGSTVKLREVDTGDEDLYKMVGEAALQPPLDYVEVTATSPMGEALLKARVGDKVRVSAPRGEKIFEVLEVS